MGGGAADRAPEEIFNGDQTVTAVEMEHIEDFMLASAQVNPKEIPSQRRRGEHGGTDTVTLRQKRLGAIEHVGGLCLAIAGLIANVERGHDGGP
jgi:hypothetical protein